MRELEVSPTTFYEISLDGGWKARVPSITIRRDDPRFLELVGALARLGMPPAQTEAHAISSCQGLFEGSWVTKLKMSVGRYAREYKRRFGSLDGFSPEIAQKAFLPEGDVIWKRAANSNLLLSDDFGEMRRET